MTLLCLVLLAAAGDTPGWVTAAPQAGGPPVAAPVGPDDGLLPGPAPAEAAPSAGGFEQRLAALELALSATVVQPRESWRFDALRREAAALDSLAGDLSQRDAARRVAERIDRFAEIAGRHRAYGEAPLAGESPRRSPERVAPPVRLTKAASADADGGHDAVGVLRPVVSKRPGAPKWAIVDSEGRLTVLVTPSPENEQRFESLAGRRVALDGQRGFLSELRQKHLVAERVTPLRR